MTSPPRSTGLPSRGCRVGGNGAGPEQRQLAYPAVPWRHFTIRRTRRFALAYPATLVPANFSPSLAAAYPAVLASVNFQVPPWPTRQSVTPARFHSPMLAYPAANVAGDFFTKSHAGWPTRQPAPPRNFGQVPWRPTRHIWPEAAYPAAGVAAKSSQVQGGPTRQLVPEAEALAKLRVNPPPPTLPIAG